MKAFRASREQLAAAEAQLAERPSADASAAEAPRYLGLGLGLAKLANFANF